MTIVQEREKHVQANGCLTSSNATPGRGADAIVLRSSDRKAAREKIGIFLAARFEEVILDPVKSLNGLLGISGFGPKRFVLPERTLMSFYDCRKKIKLMRF